MKTEWQRVQSVLGDCKVCCKYHSFCQIFTLDDWNMWTIKMLAGKNGGKSWGEDGKTGCVKTHQAMTILKLIMSIKLMCCIFLLVFPGSICSTGAPQLASFHSDWRLPDPFPCSLSLTLLLLTLPIHFIINPLFLYIWSVIIFCFVTYPTKLITHPPIRSWDSLSADTKETSGWCHVVRLLFQDWHQLGRELLILSSEWPNIFGFCTHTSCSDLPLSSSPSHFGTLFCFLYTQNFPLMSSPITGRIYLSVIKTPPYHCPHSWKLLSVLLARQEVLCLHISTSVASIQPLSPVD